MWLSVGPNHVCQMYIPLSMLWILTVHKKIWRIILFFGCIFRQPWRKRKYEKTSRHSVSDLYPKKAHGCWQNFLLQFTKRLNTICMFFGIWLQSCSSVGLHCASLSSHTAYLNPRPPFYPFHCVLPALTSCQTTTWWCLQLLISVSQWKGPGQGAFKTPPKDV